MKGEKDYYQILGIQPNASFEDVRKAYRLYAAKFHPDKHNGDVFFEERFKELTEAYDTLSNEKKRAGYDIRRFGKSRVIRKHRSTQDGINVRKPGKLRFEISHLDIYLTLFYLINLVTWVLIKRLNANASTEGNAVSLFLCGTSTLIMWVFITQLIDARNQDNPSQRPFPVGYLILALLTGSIPLITNWIP